MTCEIKIRAAEIFKIMQTLLDEKHLAETIDRPIDEAAGSFQYEVEYPVSSKEFHKIVAQFMEAIYENGLGTFAKPDPLSSALALLEKHYQGVYASGYAAARIEANDTEHGGMDSVLQRFAESIKTLERAKHARAVFVRHLDPDDWEMRCEIAKLLLEYCQPFLPPQMCHCVPSQFADDIPLLMNIYLNNKNITRHISSSL